MSPCQITRIKVMKVLVVIGSCLSFNLLWGVSYSPGIYYIIFLDVFGESRARTAWIGSLMLACSLLSSPISSLLVNRYGCRVTVIIGGLLTVTGLAASSQAQSLHVLYITYGIIAGTGCGLLCVPSLVIINEHFNEYRPILYGIATGCGAFGSFIFPPTIRFLDDMYGWRGSLLLCAGIAMHICLAGALMHPGYNIKKVRANLEHEAQSDKNWRLNTHDNEEKIDKLDKVKRSDHEILYSEDGETVLHSKKSGQSIAAYGDDTYLSAEHQIEVEATLLTNSEPDEHLQNKLSWKKLLHLEDLMILKDISFIVLCVNQVLYCFAASIIYVHLGAFAEFTLHVNKLNTVMLFSMIGISTMICKIIWGFLLRRNALYHRTMLLYTVTLLLTGIAALFLPLITSYAGLVVFCIVFGISFSALGGAHLTITTQQIAGDEKLSLALGLVIFFEGSGQIAGPPVAGLIYDNFHSYHGSFIMSGLCALTSCGIMAIPLWIQAKHAKERRTNIEKDVNSNLT